MMTPEEIEALRHWSVSNQDEGSDMFIADLNRILTEISGRPEFLGLAYEIEAVLDAITGPQGPQEPS